MGLASAAAHLGFELSGRLWLFSCMFVLLSSLDGREMGDGGLRIERSGPFRHALKHSFFLFLLLLLELSISPSHGEGVLGVLGGGIQSMMTYMHFDGSETEGVYRSLSRE